MGFLNLRIFSLLMGMVFLSLIARGQENCTPSISKKSQKILDKVYNDTKLTLDERRDLLQESLEEDDNCLDCRFALARVSYQLAVERNLSYEPAYTHFKGVVDQCPGYHADALYYAGIIAYANQDFEEALSYFTSFLTFDKENGKVSRDYSEKEQDIAAVLPEIRFYVDFYANPVPFDPQLVEGVSSPADEYLPMLSPDNALMFFTRKEMVKNKGDLYAREVENFMQAVQVAKKNDYADPQALPPPFNVGDNYGGVSLSLDNREMFITVCKPVSSSYKNCDIYVSKNRRVEQTDGSIKYEWSGLENLGPEVNTEGWEAQPTLSADGNTLYFATVRQENIKDKDGNPTIDIYATQRINGGAWTKAEPIGGEINTDGNDKSPFLHVDSRTLYFSSNGRVGAGGYDIFFCKQNAAGDWTKPKNLGYPINSPQDEHGLIVSTDGTKAFFASSNVKSSRGLDIYSFDVPQSAKPEKVLILKGDIKTESGELVKDARIQLKYTETKEVKEVEVDKYDGTYSAVVNLRKDEDVLVSVKSETAEIAFNTRVFTMADTADAVKDIRMEVEPLESGKTYKIHDINFPTASSDIESESKWVLDEFAEYLKENKSLIVEIGGHTDDVGDPQKNMVLSTDRAFEVFGYLQDKGISSDRMTFKGYGQTKPLFPNNSEANRAKNRRTEFKVNKR